MGFFSAAFVAVVGGAAIAVGGGPIVVGLLGISETGVVAGVNFNCHVIAYSIKAVTLFSSHGRFKKYYIILKLFKNYIVK
ncbi:unnamed protein product [Rhizophagus irregularis]|nr:unnamed protein product [Rhizophagus irregularis]